VDAALLLPYPGAPDVEKIHDEIVQLMKENPGKIFGIVSLNPHMDEERYLSEVERLVKDEGFVGVKLHTIGHAINPLSSDATKVFEAAKRLHIPVIVHTGMGIPFALPSLVIPRAKAYPNVKIVLYHSGWQVFSPEDYVAASVCDNVYLETSWCSVLEKSWFINALGSDRVLFGSDLPENQAAEIFSFKSLNISDKDLENVLGKTAIRVFDLKI
jgi:hypothetical protein